MLNFIVLGFIFKRLLEIKKSKQFISKNVPNKGLWIFLLFGLVIIGLYMHGYDHKSIVFTVSLIGGLLGLLILTYISKYVHEI